MKKNEKNATNKTGARKGNGNVLMAAIKKGNKYVIIAAVGAIMLLIILIMIFSETISPGKVTFVNETDVHFDSMGIYFDNTNSDYLSYGLIQPYNSGDIYVSEVGPRSEVKGSFDSVRLYQKDAELFVRLVYEGKEIDYLGGSFNVDFKGRITIRIYEKGDRKLINLRAESSAFKLFSKTLCNVSFYLE